MFGPIVTYSFIYPKHNFPALTLGKFLLGYLLLLHLVALNNMTKEKKLSLLNSHRTLTKGEIVGDSMKYKIV